MKQYLTKQFKPDTLEYINNHPNWKYYCIEKGCNKKISRRAIRCASHANIIKSTGKNNPMFGKIGGMKGKKQSQNCKKILREKRLGILNPFFGKKHSKNTRKKMSIKRKGIIFSTETCKKITESHLNWWKNNSKAKIKFGKESKKRWLNSKYKKKIIKKLLIANKNSPNKQEIKLTKILEINFFNKYKFVGNGKFFLRLNKNCFVPDFIDKRNRKIIELFGEYWHKKSKKRDKLRLKIYQKLGYKTLVIWQKELTNINKLIKKIKKFHK